MVTTVSRAAIDPGEVSFAKKILAGTTFSFEYPNPNGYARSVFPERNKHVVIRFRDSDISLDGIVTDVSNEPVSSVECADPIGLLRDKKISPEFLNTLTGRDCARAIADIILKDAPDFVSEAIEGTNPLIPLPQDFIDKQMAANKLIQNILDYIRSETNRLSPTPVDYFFGFIASNFRFMVVPPVSAEEATLTLDSLSDIFDEEPIFHFDRLINTAKVTGKNASGAAVEGLKYRDEHSIAMYGVREPDKPLTLDTDDPILLYKLARDTVESNKKLLYSRKISVPDGYYLTPGIHTVDVQKSNYGVTQGMARVVQVEGSTGSGGRVTVTLDALPLDDAEVLRKVVS